MTGIELARELGMLLLAGAGLFEGLVKLSTSPLPAVLIILSAMFLLLPAGSLSGVRIRDERPRSENEIELNRRKHE
jgi:hypothetical protein